MNAVPDPWGLYYYKLRICSLRVNNKYHSKLVYSVLDKTLAYYKVHKLRIRTVFYSTGPRRIFLNIILSGVYTSENRVAIVAVTLNEDLEKEEKIVKNRIFEQIDASV